MNRGGALPFPRRRPAEPRRRAQVGLSAAEQPLYLCTQRTSRSWNLVNGANNERLSVYVTRNSWRRPPPSLLTRRVSF
ncbi:hypothetical protein EVAR_27887_1 [Eumeta japonica]|uniref:Uncharacterized protein n=1 Tax=Eumeta variegata TaxID=151549 RepID=A0A4C1UV17_EUMVA|nr:hypothetical protein EVAR_27887_1 [Eumeta japonica]